MAFTDAKAKWDARYAGANGFLFGTEANGWLVQSAVQLVEAAEIVCIADGEGRNSTWLAGLGHKVSAFDISPVAIERLRQLAAQREVRVDAQLAGLSEWRYKPGHVDAVVAIFVQFASPSERRRMFADIDKALRPGGLLIIEGYGLRQLIYRTGGPGIADHLYTMSALVQAFAGWAVLSSRDVDQELHEGKGHGGRSHLVSAVLRKPTLVADTLPA